MEIFRNYKRDRREVMGQCLMKGEEYEAEKIEKQELFLTSMRYYVFGAESLNKKEIKMLKRAGVIKRPMSNFAHLKEGNEHEESKDLFSKNPSALNSSTS